jgi:hypothetical protein
MTGLRVVAGLPAILFFGRQLHGAFSRPGAATVQRRPFFMTRSPGHGLNDSIENFELGVVRFANQLVQFGNKLMPRTFVFSGQEREKRNMQGIGQIGQIHDGDVGGTSFHLAKIFSTQAGEFTQLVLRQSFLNP